MPRLVFASALMSLSLVTLACGDASGGSASAASTPTTVDPTADPTGSATTGTTGAAPTTGEDSGASGSTGGVKLDVPDGVTEGGTGDPGEGCPSVDILFVIDNSGSMADNQQSLVNSFPGFIAGVQAQLAGAKSYHIGVVTTDIYPQNPPGCIDIGDLITQTGGPNASGMQCTPFATGARFLDEDEPDIGAKFACMGLVGTGGSSDERPIRALLNAVSPAKNAAQGCNAGFARADSLLVIVIITDEDDVQDGCDPMGMCMSYGSGGDKFAWYDELLSYRGGIADNIVVLALIGRKLDNPCAAVPASKLLGFANMFGDNGYIGDVCADDYAPFFAEALPVIGDACMNWVPPE